MKVVRNFLISEIVKNARPGSVTSIVAKIDDTLAIKSYLIAIDASDAALIQNVLEEKGIVMYRRNVTRHDFEAQ